MESEAETPRFIKYISGRVVKELNGQSYLGPSTIAYRVYLGTEWPSEPFWDKLADAYLEGTGSLPPEIDFDAHTYFGFGSLKEWIAAVNEKPDRWRVRLNGLAFQWYFV